MKECKYCKQDIDEDKKEALMCFKKDEKGQEEIELARFDKDGELVADEECYKADQYYVKIGEFYYCDWSCVQLAKTPGGDGG